MHNDTCGSVSRLYYEQAGEIIITKRSRLAHSFSFLVRLTCNSCPFLFSCGKVDHFDDHFGTVKSCDFVFPKCAMVQMLILRQQL